MKFGKDFLIFFFLHSPLWIDGGVDGMSTKSIARYVWF